MENKGFEQIAKKARAPYLESPEKYHPSNRFDMWLTISAVLTAGPAILAFFAFVYWKTGQWHLAPKHLWEIAPFAFGYSVIMAALVAIIWLISEKLQKKKGE